MGLQQPRTGGDPRVFNTGRVEASPVDPPVVYLVDDEPAVLRAIGRLLRTRGLDIRTYVSPVEFLDAHDPDVLGCAIIDLAMPELNGLELQSALTERGLARPIIFISGRGDIPASVQAIKGGAVDFLTKPIEEDRLVAAIDSAIAADTVARQRYRELCVLRQRLATLTARERDVFTLVVTGRLNKLIGGDLGIAEKTVKVYRANVMKKMRARSLAELIRISDRLNAPMS